MEKTQGDFWNHPYYWCTKLVFRAIGHWPYQSQIELIICRLVLHSFYWIQIIPQIAVLIRHYDDFDLIMELISSIVTDIAVLVNICTFYLNSDKMVFLLEEIKKNWDLFPSDNGLPLLHKYSRQGSNWALLYAGGLYIAWFIFVTEPVYMRIVAFFTKSNSTIPLKFAIPVDYCGLIDIHNYYYTIVIVGGCSIFGIVTVIVAGDILFFLFSQHVCGFFQALGFTIENMPVDKVLKEHDDFYQYNYVKKCAQLHNRAIEFANIIEDLYCWNFFILSGFNMLVISIIAVVTVTNLDALEKVIKTLMYALAAILHLFTQCFMSQRIADCSLNIQQSLMNAQWYHSSWRTKNLIKFMTMRSQIPCQITAGKVLVMSLSTFSSIIRMSATYFTVFLDMQ